MTIPSLPRVVRVVRGSGAWRALGCALLAGLLPAIAAQAQTVNPDIRLKLMTDFRQVYPGLVNLSAPSGPPLLAEDGQLYGLSNHPGCSSRGAGIYRTAAAAGSSYTVSQLCTGPDAVPRYDMNSFVGPLVKNSKGQMFGLAYDGVNSRPGSVVDQGAIFRFTPGNWAAPEIIAAAGKVVFPRGGLVMGPDDSLYGMDEGPDVNTRTGRIFKIDAAGRFSVLYSFIPATDGGPPVSLTIASDGWLYGTTESPYPAGGAAPVGALYRIRTDGTGFERLHAFTLAEGLPMLSTVSSYVQHLSLALIEADSDWLYGTLANGSTGGGAIYRIRKDGSAFALVHEFAPSSTTNGSTPAGPMALGADGHIYGTTTFGGANGDGTLYRIVRASAGAPGTFELLHSFALAVDGKAPTGLLLGSDGRLYGSAANGGPPYEYQGFRNIIYVPNAYGTVFQIELDATRPGATLSLTASPTSMTVGDIATLTWGSENTGSCTASGAWSGSRAASGSERITTTAHGNFTYTLTCTDALKGGTVSAAATLNVNPPATVVQPAQSVGNGGGGGPLSALLLAALGLPAALRMAARRRQARQRAATDHRDECRPEDMGA